MNTIGLTSEQCQELRRAIDGFKASLTLTDPLQAAVVVLNVFWAEAEAQSAGHYLSNPTKLWTDTYRWIESRLGRKLTADDLIDCLVVGGEGQIDAAIAEALRRYVAGGSGTNGHD